MTIKIANCIATGSKTIRYVGVCYNLRCNNDDGDDANDNNKEK